MKQTKEEKQHILDNLPEGTRRIQVVSPNGKQQYKRPEEVDIDTDEISIAPTGAPIVMRGKPGRKPKVVRNAVTPQIAQTCQARDEHVSANELSNTIKEDANSDRVIENILLEMAQDAATIDFEKDEASRTGGDVSGLLTKKARILKGMSDIWLRKKSLDEGGIIDLESGTFEAVFGLILETFKETLLESGVHDEHIETIFAKLVSSLDDQWKEEAKRRMRQERGN